MSSVTMYPWLMTIPWMSSVSWNASRVRHSSPERHEGTNLIEGDICRPKALPKVIIERLSSSRACGLTERGGGKEQEDEGEGSGCGVLREDTHKGGFLQRG